MVYLRSIIAGVVALLLAAVLIQAIVIVAAIVHGSYGNARWVLLFHWHVVPIDLLLPIIIFGAGFYWEYRRLSK